MSAGSGPVAPTDAPVLLTGDAEADLGALVAALQAVGDAPSVALGIAAACASLRLSEFAVVVADVASAEEALAVMRAAGRGRPAARVVCLLPAHFEATPDLHAYIETHSFAVRRHPLADADLRGLVRAAQRDFSAERGPRGDRPERERWRQAERRLSDAFRALVEDASGHPCSSAAGAVIEQAVAATARAARTGEDGPALLVSIAQAVQAGQRARLEGAA